MTRQEFTHLVASSCKYIVSLFTKIYKCLCFLFVCRSSFLSGCNVFSLLSGYMKRYRYCEYLGKYFCPCCHSNDLAYIPGRILRKWDFTKYYVANFSRDLIGRIYDDPLFNIQDINPGLYRKVRVLEQVREWRLQLQLLRSFLATCRNGFR